jgi:hypothetical protein
MCDSVNNTDFVIFKGLYGVSSSSYRFVLNKRPFCSGIHDDKINAASNLQRYLRAKYCPDKILAEEISGQQPVYNIYKSAPRDLVLNL